jgi:tRNA(Arg) A34 adenosine deaminase TadA
VVVRRRGSATVAAADTAASDDGEVLAACADTTVELGGKDDDGALDGGNPPGPGKRKDCNAAMHHPLGHAVMRCIEEVARLERQVAARHTRRRGPVGGAARPEVEEPRCQEEQAEGSEAAAADDDAGASTASATDGTGEATADAGEPAPAQHHLCADCDVYLTHEPCPMCAMALVHSRVRRIMYALPVADGALGSRYELHAERSLNHHFCAIRNVLRQDARDAGLLADSAPG